MDTFGAARGRSNARTCPHKQMYHTWAIAEVVAKRVRRQRGDIVHPYRCRSCARYHVGAVLDVDGGF